MPRFKPHRNCYGDTMRTRVAGNVVRFSQKDVTIYTDGPRPYLLISCESEILFKEEHGYVYVVCKTNQHRFNRGSVQVLRGKTPPTLPSFSNAPAQSGDMIAVNP